MTGTTNISNYELIHFPLLIQYEDTEYESPSIVFKPEDILKGVALKVLETEFRIKQALPDRLSDLIMLALEDLNKIESQEDLYRIDMDTYHTYNAIGRLPKQNELCSVCLAGCVIANTFQSDRKRSLDPHNFEFYDSNKLIQVGSKLRALDAIVWGNIPHALFLMGYNEETHNFHRVDMVSYAKHSSNFKTYLQCTVDLLRTKGF